MTDRRNEYEDQEQEELLPLQPSSETGTDQNYRSTEDTTDSSVTSRQSNADAGTEIVIMNLHADRLSARLIACGGNEAMERVVLTNSFDISYGDGDGDDDLSCDQGDENEILMDELNINEGATHRRNNYESSRRHSLNSNKLEGYDKTMIQRVIAMFSLAVLGLMIIVVLLQIGTLIVGPPKQPIGAYKLVEIQVRSVVYIYQYMVLGKILVIDGSS